jgi:hypothetical protein
MVRVHSGDGDVSLDEAPMPITGGREDSYDAYQVRQSCTTESRCHAANPYGAGQTM